MIFTKKINMDIDKLPTTIVDNHKVKMYLMKMNIKNEEQDEDQQAKCGLIDSKKNLHLVRKNEIKQVGL